MSTSTMAVIAASAAIANATKASGLILHVTPEEFSKILGRTGEPLVAYAPPRGMFARRHVYLTTYRGLGFYTSSPEPIDVSRAEVVITKTIWAPH